MDKQYLSFRIQINFNGTQNASIGITELSFDSVYRQLTQRGIKFITGFWITGRFYEAGNARLIPATITGMLRAKSPLKIAIDNYSLNTTTPIGPGPNTETKQQFFAMATQDSPWEGRTELVKDLELEYYFATSIQANNNDSMSFDILLELQ